MKKFTKFLVGLLLIGSIFVFPFWTTQAVKADSGYVIDDYYVEILVKKDGSYLITETIKVNFLELSRGIYRNLPTKYWMNWDIEGKTYVREYLFSISNIKVNEVNEIEKFKQGIQIRIGNPDVYIIGEKIYKLSYVVHTKDLDLEGRQLFYYNVIGTEWTTEIKHAHFSIKFENEIDYSNVQIYNGRANESKTNTKVSCQYNRNDYRIDCETTEALVSKEAITVWLHLPDDFFKFPDYTYLYILSSAFSSLLAFGL